jgi:L-fuconate dehydratase
MFDFVAISASSQNRWIEYVDHLHEHFLDPVEVSGGHYAAPRNPGSGAALHPRSRSHYRFPDGGAWRPETND